MGLFRYLVNLNICHQHEGTIRVTDRSLTSIAIDGFSSKLTSPPYVHNYCDQSMCCLVLLYMLYILYLSVTDPVDKLIPYRSLHHLADLQAQQRYIALKHLLTTSISSEVIQVWSFILLTSLSENADCEHF